MLSTTSYRIEVLDSFEALKQALNSFKKAFCCQIEKELPGWFQAPSQLFFPIESASREKTIAFLSQMEYLNNQEPREILIGSGVFSVHESTLLTIQ